MVDGAIIESEHASGITNITIFTADDGIVEQVSGVNTDNPQTKIYSIYDNEDEYDDGDEK